jgi:catechol 2,3-dioxygenase-like lactoylglutathione lyase family enzyme
MKRVTAVFPIFSVSNLDESLRYYRERLGFEVGWTWGDPPSRAGLKLDVLEIQIESSGLGAPPGQSVVYCHMIGVDEYYELCRSRGAHLTREIADRPWGVRDFQVIDPSGNRLGFAEPL